MGVTKPYTISKNNWENGLEKLDFFDLLSLNPYESYSLEEVKSQISKVMMLLHTDRLRNTEFKPPANVNQVNLNLAVAFLSNGNGRTRLDAIRWKQVASEGRREWVSTWNADADTTDKMGRPIPAYTQRLQETRAEEIRKAKQVAEEKKKREAAAAEVKWEAEAVKLEKERLKKREPVPSRTAKTTGKHGTKSVQKPAHRQARSGKTSGVHHPSPRLVALEMSRAPTQSATEETTIKPSSHYQSQSLVVAVGRNERLLNSVTTKSHHHSAQNDVQEMAGQKKEVRKGQKTAKAGLAESQPGRSQGKQKMRSVVDSRPGFDSGRMNRSRSCPHIRSNRTTHGTGKTDIYAITSLMVKCWT